MKLNLPELNRKLIAAARAHPPSDRVPYAFEKRILARLSAPTGLDHWALWSRGLWRAAAPCVGIMLLFSAWTAFGPPDYSITTHGQPTDLSQDFEDTLLAAAAQDQSPDPAW